MKILLLSICTLFFLGCEGGKGEQENRFTDQQGVQSKNLEPSKESPTSERADLGGSLSQKVQIDLEGGIAVVNEKPFSIAVATTPAERRQGLMNVESMPQDTGMLFIFENEAVYPFWMKNTLIPLTIIWIDSELNIVDQQDAEPCKVEQCPNYVPSGKAKYVLEVNKGALEG